MAGYIEWSKGLPDKREVVLIAARLKRDRFEIAARLMTFWEWCDDNIPEEAIDDEGNAVIVLSPSRGDTEKFIDEKSGVKGLGKALASDDVKWLIHGEGGKTVLPHFGRHNGATAKTRTRNAKNQARRRAILSPISVTDLSPESDDKNATLTNPTLKIVDSSKGQPEFELRCCEGIQTGHLDQTGVLCGFHRAAHREQPERIPPTERCLLRILGCAVHARSKDRARSRPAVFRWMVTNPSRAHLDGDVAAKAKAMLAAHRAWIAAERAAGRTVDQSLIPLPDEPEGIAS